MASNSKHKLYSLLKEIIEEEIALDEFNAIGSGAVSGVASDKKSINQTGSPFDIDMKPQQTKIWSGDKPSSA